MTDLVGTAFSIFDYHISNPSAECLAEQGYPGRYLASNIKGHPQSTMPATMSGKAMIEKTQSSPSVEPHAGFLNEAFPARDRQAVHVPQFIARTVSKEATIVDAPLLEDNLARLLQRPS